MQSECLSRWLSSASSVFWRADRFFGLLVRPNLCGGQQDMLRRFLVRRQRVSLTPVDEVKGHGLLLLDERFLLPVRLEETNTAVMSSDLVTVPQAGARISFQRS